MNEPCWKPFGLVAGVWVSLADEGYPQAVLARIVGFIRFSPRKDCDAYVALNLSRLLTLDDLAALNAARVGPGENGPLHRHEIKP